MAQLHYQVIDFFVARMSDHSAVLAPLSVFKQDEEYFCNLSRTLGRPPILVHLSDAYDYTYYDFVNRPKSIKSGDFVLIARPEADYALEARKAARQCQIGLGKLSDLMGALNMDEVWKYIPKGLSPEARAALTED